MSLVNRRNIPALFVSTTILVLAACGGGAAQAPAAGSGAQNGAPTTPTTLAAYDGADRQQVLEAGAKKEGTLTWYTSLAGPILDSLSNAFKAKYPFLKMDVYRG